MTDTVITDNTQDAQPIPSLSKGTAPALGDKTVETLLKDTNKDTPKDTAPKLDTTEDVTSLVDDTSSASDEGYVETAIPELNELVATLKDNKVPYAKANLVLKEAFAKSDASLLDKQVFEEILGKDVATLAYTQARLAIQAQKAASLEMKSELNKLAGGSFDALADKARTMLSKQELEDYQELINTGGAARRLAIRELVARCGTSSTNKALLTGDSSISTNEGFVDKITFQKRMNEILDKHTRAGVLTQEGRQLMATLEASRLASIKQSRK